MKNGHNYPLLSGLNVIELEGYLPVAFLGKVLHDFGGSVTLLKQTKPIEIMKIVKHLHEGKQTLKLDLKNISGERILKKILQKTDVLIDGYRPGVLEKLNLNPKDLVKDNPKLIIIRVTGYGQD